MEITKFGFAPASLQLLFEAELKEGEFVIDIIELQECII